MQDLGDCLDMSAPGRCWCYLRLQHGLSDKFVRLAGQSGQLLRQDRALALPILLQQRPASESFSLGKNLDPESLKNPSTVTLLPRCNPPDSAPEQLRHFSVHCGTGNCAYIRIRSSDKEKWRARSGSPRRRRATGPRARQLLLRLLPLLLLLPVYACP